MVVNYVQASAVARPAKGSGTGMTGGAEGKEASSYFRRAHSKSEVVRQPASLQGGMLKEYQLQGLQWMVGFLRVGLGEKHA